MASAQFDISKVYTSFCTDFTSCKLPRDKDGFTCNFRNDTLGDTMMTHEMEYNISDIASVCFPPYRIYPVFDTVLFRGGGVLWIILAFLPLHFSIRSVMGISKYHQTLIHKSQILNTDPYMKQFMQSIRGSSHSLPLIVQVALLVGAVTRAISFLTDVWGDKLYYQYDTIRAVMQRCFPSLIICVCSFLPVRWINVQQMSSTAQSKETKLRNLIIQCAGVVAAVGAVVLDGVGQDRLGDVSLAIIGLGMWVAGMYTSFTLARKIIAMTDTSAESNAGLIRRLFVVNDSAVGTIAKENKELQDTAKRVLGQVASITVLALPYIGSALLYATCSKLSPLWTFSAAASIHFWEYPFYLLLSGVIFKPPSHGSKVATTSGSKGGGDVSANPRNNPVISKSSMTTASRPSSPSSVARKDEARKTKVVVSKS
jgi:hypothetical protein